jgi:hypothetical protein
MRRLCLAALLVLTGCQNLVGPFRPRPPQRVDDPSITISEQERRGRARYALPDGASNPYIGPNVTREAVLIPGETYSH